MSKADSVQKGVLNTLPSNAGSFIRQKILLRDYAPFSAATLWRLVSAGKFPRPIKITNQIIAWRLSDVLEWSKNPELYNSN